MEHIFIQGMSYVGYIDLSVVVLLQKFQPLFAVSLAAIILKEAIKAVLIIGFFRNGRWLFSNIWK